MQEDKSKKYHIQPYHMNGLNWRLVIDNPKRDNIIVVTGFMPSWWTGEYEITFGEEFHLDSVVHQKTLVKMGSILKERFGDLPNFFCGDDYLNSYPIERRYGDALIPALFGCNVSFDDASGHPYAVSLNLDDEQVSKLTVPDMENNPVLRPLIPQLRDTHIKITGELGFEGVVNIAYKLRGQEMFIDMVKKPGLIHHLFDIIWETINTVVHKVRKCQYPEHTKPHFFVNCNCLINMLSGKMYRAQLLEFDKRFSKSFEIFGIHTCNWTIDPYLNAIAEIDGLGYLDMGTESDIDKVHKLFPNLCPSVFFHPENIKRLSEKKIKKEISELCKRIDRGYILLSDLEFGTKDSQIRAAYEAAAKF